MSSRAALAIRWALDDLHSVWWNLTVNVVASSVLTPRIVRYAIYRAWGMHLGLNVLHGCFFATSSVSAGPRTFINRGCRFDGPARIQIGSRCAIGLESVFCTGTHGLGPPTQRASSDVAAPIHVGDGCWLGARVLVLPGVTIGPGCVIAAGAVVPKDCEANGLYAGVPARRIRDLPS